MTSLSATAKWVPSIDDTTELIGIILLFIPYMIILLPFLQTRIIIFFQRLYLHRTPRDDWNSAVDQHPPRRLAGYIFSIIFTFTAILLILINNNYNNYWVDFMQYFIYLSLPLILSIMRPPSHRPCDIFDFLIILLVIMPIEISQEIDAFLPDIHFTIYPSWGNSPHISILNVCGFNLFLFIFFIFRPLDHIGLNWNVTTNKFNKFIAVQFVFFRFICIMCIFLILAIPFCLIPNIKYLHSSIKLSNVWIDGIAKYFCLFFLEILIIEFLYRGIIQNLLHSALDFRTEARSYLRGRDDSVTSMLNHFETGGTTTDMNYGHTSHSGYKTYKSNGIELLWKSKKRPLIDDDIKDSKSNLNSTVSVNRYDINRDETDTINTFYSLDHKRDTLGCTMGICYCIRFDNLRDWIVILIGSVIYGGTIIDYRNYENSKDLIYAFILMFWLGFCCGWLFRLTNSCFISAVFNSLVIFNFRYIFNPNTQFCNGAC